MYYTDENIKNLKRIYDQNSRKQYVRLDLNENPGGLDENFIEQTLKEITPRLISEYTSNIAYVGTTPNIFPPTEVKISIIYLIPSDDPFTRQIFSKSTFK